VYPKVDAAIKEGRYDVIEPTDAASMIAADGRHFENLSFEEFDAFLSGENPDFTHVPVLGDRKPASLYLKWHGFVSGA